MSNPNAEMFERCPFAIFKMESWLKKQSDAFVIFQI